MNHPITVTLPDGSTKEFAKGVTGLEVLNILNIRNLSAEALVMKVNGEIQELYRPITEDASVQFLTWEDAEGKAAFWHSSAHILAEAIEALYPGVKFGIGPPIEEGFYYDIDLGENTISPEDFEKIEKKFLELAASGETFERRLIPKAEAIAYFTQKNDPYKLELIEGLEDGNITFYYSGNFVDLCKGPHIINSKFIKAVKILNLAGAYWRGDSKNKQLTRVYAISFPTKKELEEYLARLEEAKKRDHRRLGKELKLFSFHEEGPGFPFWHHNGMIVMNALQNQLRKRLLELSYEEIKTPIILNEQLWHQSGHYQNYKENMYFTTIDDKNYAVKPMNCPGSTLIYRTEQRSYRDLPLKLFEFGLVHRHELSGVLTGLFRVRSFTQDDAHIFCTPEQVEQEIAQLINLVFEVYGWFGFTEVNVFLSTRPEKYIGSLEIWESAENALHKALQQANISYTINPGDGAFYGPKIDFVVKDSLKRSWQLGTIQLDFSMPIRFNLEYIGADGNVHRPVMIHRAILG
ncbi:MAG: threonine--tRNA ligase, partial [Bacteroidia bacterium]|nr:threonine--tRNA ligase [Bacteroidia bacterium]MDW8158754.1 threonine--tRNA ligase [Bacteroidia bacterium]